MTTKDKLILLLEQKGFRDVDIRPAMGYWRTSKFSDVYRWEGFAKVLKRDDLPEGTDVTLSSWDTMTSCVRLGITLDPGDASLPTDFLVIAKGL